MNFDKDNRKNLLIGLLGSAIFFIVLQPLILLAWNFIQYISGNTYNFFVDAVYEASATEDYQVIEFFTACFLQVSFVGIPIFYALIKEEEFKKFKQAKMRVKKENYSLENIETKIRKLEKTKKTLSKVIIVLTVLMTLALFLLLTESYVTRKTILDYHQKVNAISPYISDNDLKKIKSDWALMKTQEDYNKIIEKLKSIAKSQNIKLPESF